MVMVRMRKALARRSNFGHSLTLILVHLLHFHTFATIAEFKMPSTDFRLNMMIMRMMVIMIMVINIIIMIMTIKMKNCRDFQGYADKEATKKKVMKDVWRKGDMCFR